MVINKVNVYLTSEEIDKRSNLYYALFEHMISKYVKKCFSVSDFNINIKIQ